MIRARTKAALARAKANGRPVGNPMGAKAFGENAGKGAVEARRRKAAEFVEKVGWAVQTLHDEGKTLRQIADKMNEMKVPARRGGQWSAATVKRVLDALAKQEAQKAQAE